MSGKLYYCGIFRADTKPAFELYSERELKYWSRWTAPSIDQFMTFFSKTIAERTPPGQRQVVTEQGNVIYSYAKSDGLVGVVITDEAYPAAVAHKLVSVILDAFTANFPKATWSKSTTTLPVAEIKKKFQEYQEPDKIDGITQIQRELRETKDVLHKTIESVLERGEKLDTLVAKSDGLSASSRAFYTTAKSKNGCCTMM